MHYIAPRALGAILSLTPIFLRLYFMSGAYRNITPPFERKKKLCPKALQIPLVEKKTLIFQVALYP